MLGYVYTKEDLSTIAPVLWQQPLFVPLEVPLALFCSEDLSAIAPVLSFSFAFTSLSHRFQGAFSLPFGSFLLWTSFKIVEQYISYGNIWV